MLEDGSVKQGEAGDGGFDDDRRKRGFGRRGRLKPSRLVGFSGDTADGTAKLLGSSSEIGAASSDGGERRPKRLGLGLGERRRGKWG